LITEKSITNPDGYDDGELLFISPFTEQTVCYLGAIEFSTSEITDLRLFINHLDSKLLTEITVAKSQELGHFTSLSAAVAYSSNFLRLFPGTGSPSIKIGSGIFEFSEQILLDFDIQISGSGPNTILRKTGAFAAGAEPVSGNIDLSKSLFLIGAGVDSSSTRIERGVTLRDFTYETSDSITNVGAAIVLSQKLRQVLTAVSPDAMYRFENINFYGPASITRGGAVDANKIGEYALIVSEANAATFVPTSAVVMGNIVFRGCRLKRMGLEEGAIKFGEGNLSYYQNIIVTDNIATNMAPNYVGGDFEIIEYPVSGTITTFNFIEDNNTSAH